MDTSFLRAVHSELLKFFTTRLWWGMAIGVFLSAAVFAGLFGVLLTSDDAGGASGIPAGDAVQVANSVYTGGLSVGYLLMLTIGVIQVGAEYRHHTITSTFLATPRRSRAMLAKVVALLVVGLWALIGLGVGILIPNQVAALLIGVGVAWIVEPLLGLAVKAWDFGREHIAPYFPSEATSAVINAVQNSPDDVRLSWWAAALTLAAWAALLSGIGIVLTVRRDVS